MAAPLGLEGDATEPLTVRKNLIVDVAMIAAQVDGIKAAELDVYMMTEVSRRLDSKSLRAALPETFALTEAQAADWQRRWRRATTGGCG